MIKIAIHNDGKKEDDSFSAYFQEEDFYNLKLDLNSHDPFDARGYGPNVKAAIDNLTEQIEWIIKEWQAVYTLLTETSYFEECGSVEVDCFGKEIR